MLGELVLDGELEEWERVTKSTLRKQSRLAYLIFRHEISYLHCSRIGLINKVIWSMWRTRPLLLAEGVWVRSLDHLNPPPPARSSRGSHTVHLLIADKWLRGMNESTVAREPWGTQKSPERLV